jgi:TetR/AcrR family transcriptional regulator, transcriptional repressor of bet genes
VPKQVDHQERRGRIADALWAVAERDGIAATTVRHVAAEAGVSVGMVQHYFSTKDEMLLFALRWVGEEFGAAITAGVGALPEPRDPYEVVRIVLTSRLPLDPRGRIYVQALVAWLGRAIANPELARYMLEGTRLLRDYLADQLRLAQRSGRVPARFDPPRTADGLLAFADGLSSHLLQGLHTPDEALAVLGEYLDRIFDPA